MTTAKSITKIIDGWSNTPSYDDSAFWDEVEKLYSFKLRVIVSKNIPPRHSMFAWIRGMGVTKFDEIFRGDIFLPPYWVLAFPERHCSFEEIPQLISTLSKLNKEQKNVMKTLDIITSNPYIISDSMTKIVSIIEFPDGIIEYNQSIM